MVARSAHDLDRACEPGRIDRNSRKRTLHDGNLVGRILIADRQAAHTVVHRAADAGGADGVERVHRRHQAETRSSGDATQPGHMQLAFAHHRDQYVERLFRDAVDLLHVQQRAIAHRDDQRAVNEHRRVVAIGEHTSRVEVTDQPGRGQLGVAFHELEPEAELVGDGAQQRALAGSGRTFEQHVAVGSERGDSQLDLARASDHAPQHALQQGCCATGSHISHTSSRP